MRYELPPKTDSGFRFTNSLSVLVVLALFSIFFTNSLCAQLQLAKIFNNGAVLQRDTEVPVWGTAPASDTVTISLNGVDYTGIADSTGNWEITLPAMAAGGPFSMTIATASAQKVLSNIYFGDVWLASGQSNLEWPLSSAQNGAEAIAAANDQTIRQFRIPKGLSNTPSNELPNGSAWTPATSQYAGNFTAVGYYFARELRAAVDVPIGIINSSYGGSRIETWMSDDMLGFDEQSVELANGEPERQPTLAFNKMLLPLIKFPIKGVIWYQGESNADTMEDALAYRDLFFTMINGWRGLWNQGDFPFLWVQLPNFGTVYDTPQTWDAWPQLRAGQTAALTLPNTGEAITIDVGGVDIHPTLKEPVGERLALVARKVAYGEELVYSGPRYRNNYVREDGKIVVRFDHIGGGLMADSTDTTAIEGFVVAGDNNQLTWANAIIEGDSVIVWSDDVAEPVLIRYAWEHNPATANLYNAEGLPAAPFLAEVNPGFKISTFEAGRSTIENGQSTTLTWHVFGSDEIYLNSEQVDSASTMTITPMETTTYSLLAYNRENSAESDTAHVTVEVLDPNQINRVLNRPVKTSTYETCCDSNRTGNYAVDGNFDSRWASAWQEDPRDAQLDDDPNDEWIAIDLGDIIDIERVILYWEAAYGTSYNIDVSFDGFIWQTVYEERASDGEEDDIVFDAPVAGRYLRIHGLERVAIGGQKYGYSLFEIAAYGLISDVQPPSVSVTTNMGNVINTDTELTLIADAADANGTVVKATFYVDGELLFEDTEAPFQTAWSTAIGGEFAITAVVEDNDGYVVQSQILTIYIDDGSMVRYEAENAITTGQANIMYSTATSGGQWLELRDAWTMTIPEVNVPDTGEYLLSFGYQLTFESPKTQYLVVNGDTLQEVEFTAPNTAVWLQKGVTVPLIEGSNEIALHGFWNWMSFDFLAVRGAIPLSVEDENRIPETLSLAQNYPNPFNPATTISYILPENGKVQLHVFDITGSKIATLVNSVQNAGRHYLQFDAGHLASGVYFTKLHFNGTILIRRMVLVK